MSNNLTSIQKMKRLRESTKWESEQKKQEFFVQSCDLIQKWEGQLPDLSKILSPEEIDWLILQDCLKNHETDTRFVNFAIRSGYKDTIRRRKNGKGLLYRTTAIHKLFDIGKYNHEILAKLYRVYQNFDITYIDENENTHFHIACALGYKDIVTKFLEIGRSPNCSRNNYCDDSPLHLALKTTNEELILLLLKHEADPNSINKRGQTILHEICDSCGPFRENDRCNLLEKIFQICKDKQLPININIENRRKQTPLRLSTMNLKPLTTKKLLDCGAKISGVVIPTAGHLELCKWPKDNRTKLQLASAALSILENLEEKGIDPQIIDILAIMRYMDDLKVLLSQSHLRATMKYELYADHIKNLIILPKVRCEILDHKGIKETQYSPKLTLYDYLNFVDIKVAKKMFSYNDYYWLFDPKHLMFKTSRAWQRYAHEHLCEVMAKPFFISWALKAFMELTKYQLPQECCEMIIDETLRNKNCYNICCLAWTGLKFKRFE